MSTKRLWNATIESGIASFARFTGTLASSPKRFVEGVLALVAYRHADRHRASNLLLKPAAVDVPVQILIDVAEGIAGAEAGQTCTAVSRGALAEEEHRDARRRHELART